MAFKLTGLGKTTLNSLRDTIHAIDLKAESSPLSTLDINLRSKTVKDLLYYDLLNLFNVLSQDESSLLERQFSLQEVKDAVWSCGGEKAPGPDGFTFKLIKKHWSLFSEDIYSYVKEFESSGFIPRVATNGLQSTHAFPSRSICDYGYAISNIREFDPPGLRFRWAWSRDLCSADRDEPIKLQSLLCNFQVTFD
nr:cysteine-rich receptor-like protein kinase [Tanacetum cinerariifolium]